MVEFVYIATYSKYPDDTGIWGVYSNERAAWEDLKKAGLNGNVEKWPINKVGIKVRS